MTDGKKVLLAYGKEAMSRAVEKALEEAGFTVAIGSPEAKERYDHLTQLGFEPQTLTEGTRLLLEKAKSDGSSFLLVSSIETGGDLPAGRKSTYLEALRFAEALTQEFHKKHGVKATTLRLPFVYGPGIPFPDSGPIGELLSEFSTDQIDPSKELALTVYGDGKDSQHYLYLDDAAEAIRAALSVPEGEVYNALPPAPVTSASLAAMLEEMGGHRHEIKYHRGLTPSGGEVKIEGAKLPAFKAETPLEKGITETLKSLVPDEPKGRRPSKQRQLRLKAAADLSHHWRRILKLAIVALVLSPFLYAGGRLGFAAYHLCRFRSQITAFDFQAAGQSAVKAEKNALSFARFLNNIPFSEKIGILRNLVALGQGGAEAVTSLKKVAGGGESVTAIIDNFLKSYQGEETIAQTEEEFIRLASILKEAENHLTTGWVYFSKADLLPDSWAALLLDSAHQGMSALKLGSALASDAFDLLGYRGERNYLILLQNSAEIRAGGGFLGTLAQLTLKNGEIKTLNFFDSYQFDSVGGVSAPESAQKFLGVEELKLRESNFFASFPESVQKIGSIFEEGQEAEVDGVVGLNLYFIENLLAHIGPLELTDFEETVTADNLFSVATEQVEKDFFPGSSQKKRFLQALGEELLENLFSLDRSSYGQLAMTGWEGLRERNLLLSLEGSSLIQTLIETGFDGRISDSDSDFLAVIDSNYGSKANIWVERAIDYKVFNIDREDNLQGKLTVTWTHRGTEAWPSGTYGNLFRALVPKGSVLTAAALDGEDHLAEMLMTEEAGKTAFAAFLSVKPQTTVSLELSYRLPAALGLDKIENYRLRVQKQPGTAANAFSFAFEKPLGKVISDAGGAFLRPDDAAVLRKESLQREDNSLILRRSLEGDIIVDIAIEEE